MDKSGRLHIGSDYKPKVERLRRLLGATSDNDAVRSIIDGVLGDAKLQSRKTIEPREVGIKTS